MARLVAVPSTCGQNMALAQLLAEERRRERFPDTRVPNALQSLYKAPAQLVAGAVRGTGIRLTTPKRWNMGLPIAVAL